MHSLVMKKIKITSFITGFPKYRKGSWTGTKLLTLLTHRRVDRTIVQVIRKLYEDNEIKFDRN